MKENVLAKLFDLSEPYILACPSATAKLEADPVLKKVLSASMIEFLASAECKSASGRAAKALTAEAGTLPDVCAAMEASVQADVVRMPLPKMDGVSENMKSRYLSIAVRTDSYSKVKSLIPGQGSV